nr:MLO8 [Cucumis sativus]WCO04912.1 4-15 CRISPR MLO8 [Cucumis sativus]WCO04913.1 2-18 CRISPR MLO8 [Cucumis sativus]WCO04914.1 4-21 CRISPR MLO8 [Cucumis sativus]
MWNRAAYFGRYLNLGCCGCLFFLGCYFNLH